MQTLSRPTREGPVVEVAGLSKSYGEVVAVADVSFVAERGEIFGLLGTNGAGKTTSVECVQGLRRPDGGSVRVLGCDPIHERGALRSRVGSQLQDSQLPDRLKVREAVRLFADSFRSEAKAMSDWQLDEIAGSAFGDLSGGQKQRLFLALALLNDPEVVFLDELTQGLDPNARRAVWGLVEQVRDAGATVVLVTHFMEEAEVLCDRVAVVDGGRVVDTGTPAELIERHSEGVRMRFAAGEADQAWLRELPAVSSVRFERGEVTVRGRSPMIAHVGAGLVARDRVPDDIRVAQPSLEDAVLRLIGQNVQTSPQPTDHRKDRS